MDSYSYYFLFSKCQTHAYTRFENGCSEFSTQKLLTEYSTEKNINTLFAGLGWPVLRKTVPEVLLFFFFVFFFYNQTTLGGLPGICGGKGTLAKY